MGRDPAFDVDADGGDLAFDCVNAGQAFDAKGFDAKIGHRADQNFFEIADVFVDVFAIGRQ